MKHITLVGTLVLLLPINSAIADVKDEQIKSVQCFLPNTTNGDAFLLNSGNTKSGRKLFSDNAVTKVQQVMLYTDENGDKVDVRIYSPAGHDDLKIMCTVKLG